MNRWMVALATPAFSFSFSPKTTTLSAFSGFIFEGKVAALDGRPVPGAEIQLRDGSGELKHHVMSDLQGLYRFPVVLALAGETKPYRIDILHLRYQPVHVSDASRGATIGRLELMVPAPGQPVEVLASARGNLDGPTKSKLHQIQADKESRVLVRRDALRSRIGTDAFLRLQAFARQQIAPTIKVGTMAPDGK